MHLFLLPLLGIDGSLCKMTQSLLASKIRLDTMALG